MIERVDQLREPVVVGRKYLVPGIVYPFFQPWRHENKKERWWWWPVLGPRHNDAEHLNFEPWHYHVDDRFIDRRHERRIRAIQYRVDVEPIKLTIAGHPLNHRNYPDHPDIEWRVRVCRRDRMDHPVTDGSLKGQGAFAHLFAHYHGCEAPLNADGVRICPHKGAPLSSIAPDAQGFVTCPLHGLKFDRDWRSVRIGAP